jgi:hypothetical protein
VRNAFGPTAVIALALLAMTSVSLAKHRTYWLGKGIDNNKRYSLNNVAGDEWELLIDGQKPALRYETTEIKDEYIELKSKDDSTEKVRLYKDKMTMTQVGSKFKFVDFAKGQWK